MNINCFQSLHKSRVSLYEKCRNNILHNFKYCFKRIIEKYVFIYIYIYIYI